MATTVRALALALVVALAWVELASGQAEVLSITSFVACVEVDLSAQNHATGKGQNGNFLDCTPTAENDAESQGSDTVTILDLRILAGTAANDSSFQVDLTTVTSQNTPPTTSTSGSGTTCSANLDENGIPQPTDCALSSAPYSIVITGSEYIYYYDLELDETREYPYCHVMHYYQTASAQCDHIKYQGGSTTYNQYTETCSARVEQYPNCYNSGTGTTSGGAQCQAWMTLLGTANIEGIMSGFYDNGTAFNISEHYQAYSPGAGCSVGDTQRCIRTEFSSDALRKPTPIMYPDPAFNDITWDDRTSVLHGEVFPAAAFTIHELPLPSPLPYGLDQSDTFLDANGDLQILNCLGPCQAGQQNCYNTYDGNQPEAIRANGTTLDSEGFDIGLFGLGPSCSVYNVALTPRVAVTVTANITNLNTGNWSIVTTSNVQAGTRSTDTPHTFAMEIIGVGSLNTVLGPPLGGYILLCGGPTQQLLTAGGKSYPVAVEPRLINQATQPPSPAITQPFLSMRETMAPSDKVGDALYNPWEAVVEYADATSDGAKAFYPSNRYAGYQYMCVNDTDSDGRNDGAAPDDPRVCTPANYMWYYVSPENGNILGRGCGQTGMTDMFWNSGASPGQTLANAFGAETCTSDPFICFPGFTAVVGVDENATLYNQSEFTFGYSPVTGCMASTAFEIARLIGNPTNLYLTPQDLVDAAALWSVYPVNETATGGEQIEEFIQEAPERFYSLALTTNILHNFMPTAYNTLLPNYWLQNDDGPRLYMRPSVTTDNPTIAAFQPQLSVELLVYIVGKFVAFEDVIPSGEIVQTACSSNLNFTTQSSQEVAVTNTGSIAAQYQLNINCPLGAGVDPVTPIVLFPPANSDVLAPGNTSDPQIIFYTPRTSFAPEPGQVVQPCVLQLVPVSGSVFSVLDQQNVNCSHTFYNVNGTEPPPVPFFGPNNPLWEKVDCGCFNFPCYKSFHGGTLHSPCALMIAIPFFVGVAAAIMALVTGIIYKCVYYKRLSEAQGKVNAIVGESHGEFLPNSHP